jgi:hypothetical protein
MSPGLFMKLRKIQFAFSSCVSCDEKVHTYIRACRLVHIAHRLRLETREREREREREQKNPSGFCCRSLALHVQILAFV